MKRTANKLIVRIALPAALFFSLTALAQDKESEVGTDTSSINSAWYTQPWIWIVGAAIFILLLVALLRNNGKKG